MTRIIRTATLSASALDDILTPRLGLVLEIAEGPGRFVASRGPVRHYRRMVDVGACSAGTSEVTQIVEYDLAVPLLGWMVTLPARQELGRVGKLDKPPWWGPPDVLDTKAWTAVACLVLLAAVVGYLGTLMSQTVTYSAKEFGVGTGAEGVALAVVRADVIISLALVAMADRRGRRMVALGGAAIGCLLTAVGALSPSLPWLAASQILARGFVTASTISSSVLLAESMPKGARAWAIGVIAMASAVGAGVCVVALPVAGIGTRSWRLLYAAALLWLPLLAVVSRHLVESDRYTRHSRAAAASGVGATPAHGGIGAAAGARTAIVRSRLVLLATANFLLQMFAAPASEFQNEYLRRQRHFSPSRISLFVTVTVLPGAVGIVAGGRLADTRGRRGIAVIAVTGAAVGGVLLFSLAGWPMWIAGTVAAVTGAAVTPAIAVYGPELFATARRGAANGLLTAAGRVGAVIGLLVVGSLSSSLGRFGPAFGVLALGPAALVALVVFAFPETAHRSLEELNPTDLNLTPGPD